MEYLPSLLAALVLLATTMQHFNPHPCQEQARQTVQHEETCTHHDDEPKH